MENENNVVVDQTEEVQVPKKSKKKWILLGVIAVVLILILKGCGNSDESLGVKDFIWDSIDSSRSIGEVLEQDFCDVEWSNNGSDQVWAKFNDYNGIAYTLRFKVFNDGNSVTITKIYMNGTEIDRYSTDKFLEYLGGGCTYEDFTNYLIGVEWGKAIFGLD